MFQVLRIMIKKQRKIKLILPAIIAVLLIAGIILLPKLCFGQDALGDAVAKVLGWVLIPTIELIGGLITVVVRLLVDVAQYNGFVDSQVVNIGWVIIRDICNMLFVLIMIFIAFATVLKIEKYSYTKLLGAVFMAAILVNFSKLICGIIIDFSQVIMLTFVNAFSAAAEGNFINMLGLSDLMRLNSASAVTGAQTAGALILALILAIVALFAIFTMLVILLYRIIHLWFLIMMSPLAFIKNALPINIPGIGGNWWEDFGKEVVVGPLLAFFIWLSLSVVQQSTSLYTTIMGSGAAGNTQVQQLNATASAIGSSQNLLAYIVGIFLLFTSITEAQKLSSYGGAFAGKMSGKLKQWGQGAAGVATLGGLRKGVKMSWDTYRGKSRAARQKKWSNLGLGMFAKEQQGLTQIAKLPGVSKIGAVRRWGEVAQSRSEEYDKQKTGEFKQTLNAKSNEDLQKLASRSSSRHERMAAGELLLGRGVKDPKIIGDIAKRGMADRSGMVYARRDFEKSIAKASPQVSADIAYNGFQDLASTKKFIQDMQAGDFELRGVNRLSEVQLDKIDQGLKAQNKNDSLELLLTRLAKDPQELNAIFDGFGDIKNKFTGKLTAENLTYKDQTGNDKFNVELARKNAIASGNYNIFKGQDRELNDFVREKGVDVLNSIKLDKIDDDVLVTVHGAISDPRLMEQLNNMMKKEPRDVIKILGDDYTKHVETSSDYTDQKVLKDRELAVKYSGDVRVAYKLVADGAPAEKAFEEAIEKMDFLKNIKTTVKDASGNSVDALSPEYINLMIRSISLPNFKKLHDDNRKLFNKLFTELGRIAVAEPPDSPLKKKSDALQTFVGY